MWCVQVSVFGESDNLEGGTANHGACSGADAVGFSPVRRFVSFLSILSIPSSLFASAAEPCILHRLLMHRPTGQDVIDAVPSVTQALAPTAGN